jgi:ketosteroid isomerase-like protein
MVPVEDAMDAAESEVKALFESRADAMHQKDIDRLMALYAPEVVYFDLVPPLRYTGTAALRDRFVDWFGRWSGAINQDLRDLHVSASGNLAAAFMLIRASGTLKTGQEVGYWVRVSNCCRRADGKWLITHEHVSLPVDMKSRSAVMDLVP